jgi:hypothetical protein
MGLDLVERLQERARTAPASAPSHSEKAVAEDVPNAIAQPAPEYEFGQRITW